MRNLVRKPLAWMVVAECVVVAALLTIAWNLVAATSGHHLSAVAPIVQESPAALPSLPALPTSEPRAARGPLAGLNVDSGFWRSRLAALNHEQVVFEQLEWRLVHTAMDAAQRYLETVVLPSLTRAESARADPRPAEVT